MANSKFDLFKNTYFTALLISIGVVLISYLFTFTTLFENIELKSIDNRFEKRGPVNGFAEKSKVVIIGIDDGAIDNLPASYPFPRSYYAKFIENMNKAGASAVGIDILFDGVDYKNKESDSLLKEVLSTYDNVILAGRTETESVSGDRYEVKTTDSLNLRNIFYDIKVGVKLGLIYVPSDRDENIRRYAITHTASNGQVFPTFAFEIVQFLDNKANGRNDNPLIIKKEEDQIKIGSYSAPEWDGYTVLLNYYGPAQTFTYIGLDKVLDDSTMVTNTEQANIRQIAEDFGISVDSVLNDESLYTQWAEDVFDNAKIQRIARDYENASDEELENLKSLSLKYDGTFDGKVVLVGSANPEDKDMLAIPFRKGDSKQTNLTYGVEIHATAVQNLIDGNNIASLPLWILFSVLFVVSFAIFLVTSSIKHLKSRPSWFLFLVNFLFSFAAIYLAAYILLVLVFEYDAMLLFPPVAESWTVISLINFSLPFLTAGILAAVAAWLLHRSKFEAETTLEFANILLVGILGYGILGFAQYLFNQHLIMVKVVPLMSSLILGYFSSIAYQYLTESKQKKVIKGIFSHYVNKEVVDKMLENPDSVRLGGEKVELTIMFSDLSGFTTISEMLTPEELVVLLNEYLGSMTDIIMQAGGTLDKYIGDAIMAFWGAPIPQEKHAILACRAVMKQQAKLKVLAQGWVDQGFPRLIARFGVNTGQVVAGNMGSSSRFNYTVMGDSVNLAARLEPANKEFDTLVMISEFTYEKVKDEFLCRQLDLLQVKGKTKPVTVYELMADRLAEEDLTHMEKIAYIYNEGLKLYYAQQFSEAIKVFEQVLTVEPNDGPSKTYIKRCHDFMENPPGADWTGVYVMKHK
ncbi:MAG: CHASE2 domain-containing protein [Bacteroidetes bacterium]|nr:CHASE2 domain-containing protein [Bacteroidota bacterium]